MGTDSDSVRCYGWREPVLCVLVVIGALLALAPSVLASAPSFTWTGGSTASEEWSFAANWEGGIAPTAETGIGTLTFPRLTSTACTIESASHPCYFSWNDISGLSAQSIQIDDGDTYLIGGQGVALGSGGLTAAPASGSNGQAGDFLELPLHLTDSQTWSITNHSGGGIGENGVFLEGDVTGSASALNIELSKGPALLLANNTEVGAMKIEGADPGVPGVDNGFAALLNGEINSSDQDSIELSHIFFFGNGRVGPLTTNAAMLGVGISTRPAGGLTAASATLDPASEVVFHVTGHEQIAMNDYSQLASTGAVELGGSHIRIAVAPPEEGKACPTLVAGRTYTLISTTGPLSGTFANAPEHGPEIPIGFAESCGSRFQTMRISYHESGGVETVTGTVEAEAREQQEAKEAKERQEREARERQEKESKERQEREAKEQQEKEARARQEQEARERREATERLEARERLEAKERQEARERQEAKEHEASKGEVLGTKEASPDATIANRSLTVSAAGTFVVKIDCPAGATKCVGTITLRTLRAVSASRHGDAAKSRAAILTLAMGSFDVAGGQAKAVMLRLSTAGRKLLVRGHILSAKATIAAHNAVGASHTDQAIVTLRAFKARHRKS